MFGAHRQLIKAYPVDRTATFVFFLGDRYYGTVTAYVSGKEAGRYHFSSALAVSLLRALAPQLRMDGPEVLSIDCMHSVLHGT